MKTRWQLQEAKSRFSELVNRVIEHGPQTVTRRGEPVVVVISQPEYDRLRKKAAGQKPRLTEFLQKCPDPSIFDVIEEDRRETGRDIDL